MIEAGPRSDAKALLLDYLDDYRAAVIVKVSGLSERELRTGRVPSGWSPLEMVKHLAAMERRWLVWGFEGAQVPDPWADHRDGRWHVGESDTIEDLIASLNDQGRLTREIVDAAELADAASTGGRFPDDAPAPTLVAILLHVLQEYSRHTGHLDIVRELIDGSTGE